LAQLSRNAERREGNRPQLSDLRESGSIEQDADMVGFIYRAEYYGLNEDESGNSTQGIGEFIIQKHRNGPTDVVKMRYQGEFTKFSSLNDSLINDNFSFTDRGGDAGSYVIGSKLNDMTMLNDSDDVPPF
jgi:replicative DNA helicase